jgi:transmembrane sensor
MIEDEQDAASEMHSMIVRSLQGGAGDIEQRRIAAWLARSPLNAKHYREIESVWKAADVLCTEVDPPSAPSFAELRQRPMARRIRRAAPPHPLARWRRRLLQTAAVFFVGVAAGYLALLDRAEPGLGTGEFVTRAGETVTLTLMDGTVVRLAPESRLRLTGSAEREVWLHGQAFFAVAKQPGSRFKVRTHFGDAVVLGTRFDLRARADEMRLLVVEGKVEVAAQGETVAVVENEVARVIGSGPPTSERADSAYIRAELDWAGDFLAFTSTPLEQVARELSFHYGVPVQVLDSTLARETVHGWFSDQPLDEVIAVVCRAVRAHCSMHAGGYVIAP